MARDHPVLGGVPHENAPVSAPWRLLRAARASQPLSALIVPSFFCPAAAGARAAIHFTKEPYSQDALHGRSAILRCEVEDPAHVEFEWLHNGLPVQDTEQRFKEGSNLQFAAVDRHRDAGDFQCVARNSLSGEEARTANASFNIKCECGQGSLGVARGWERLGVWGVMVGHRGSAGWASRVRGNGLGWCRRRCGLDIRRI